MELNMPAVLCRMIEKLNWNSELERSRMSTAVIAEWETIVALHTLADRVAALESAILDRDLTDGQTPDGPTEDGPLGVPDGEGPEPASTRRRR